MTLSIQSVSKHYRHDFWGLHSFSLELYAGVLGLLGPNGEGIVFDFGIDISECAIMKFYRAQHAELLPPFVCQLDHALGKLLGLGFYRQDTLASGAAVCDCCWNLGAETPS